jgi:hypothetical protein
MLCQLLTIVAVVETNNLIDYHQALAEEENINLKMTISQELRNRVELAYSSLYPVKKP